jgi:hypothetical protein
MRLFAAAVCIFFTLQRIGEGTRKVTLMPFNCLNPICSKTVAIWRQWRVWFYSAIVAGAIGGCGTMPPSSISIDLPDEQKSAIVRERAEARWQALINDDIATAYGYLSPATRAVVSLDQYKTKVARGTFRKVKIETIECKAELCKVSLMLTFDRPRMKGMMSPVDETWIIEQGQLWYVYRG